MVSIISPLSFETSNFFDLNFRYKFKFNKYCGVHLIQPENLRNTQIEVLKSLLGLTYLVSKTFM